MKILIYIILVASDDVETQRKGMTTIIWPGTKTPKDDEVGNLKFDRILFLKGVFECLPVRTCSMHFSVPSTPFFQVVRTLFILSMPSFMKRMKFHVGKYSSELVNTTKLKPSLRTEPDVLNCMRTLLFVGTLLTLFGQFLYVCRRKY